MCNLIIPNTTIHLIELSEIIAELKEANNFKGADKKYVYFAYLNGEVLGKFKTLKDAEAVSKITEKVWINQDEYDSANNLLTNINQAAYDILHKNVVSEMGYDENNESNKKIVANVLNIMGYDRINTLIEMSEYIKGMSAYY